ncbi:hypothetical protein AJ80_02318 [Polytolypa hystricis UAMH7299]|uniref:U4/U6 snRNA-associated-splicing factor PRP24 n=1 Tax=Polytolypa hystricis (strain UAMH7299) TaxID=1447883 RepID=A0A2B7YRN1_POLH7|nr:hypothetical protein AJ80_02318 [Polytolypa hystricis UAMH7299]
MDINSLLSPQDSPATGQSTPVNSVSPHKSYHKPRSNSNWQGMTSSPLVHHVFTPSHLREASPRAASPSVGPATKSGSGTPPSSELQATRQPSTPGMDTLADLASMQHHQPQRPNAPVLRTAESYESQLSPSTMYPNVQAVSHNIPTPRPPYEVGQADGSKDNARRDFSNTSLPPEAQNAASELCAYIQQNHHAYESRVQFVRLLHRGFVDHVYPPSSPGSRGDPHKYDLLAELRAAREELDRLFAIGEDMWAEWIQDESMLAQTVDERIGVMELCQRSVEEEFGSTKLWVIYGEWMLYLYNSASQAGEGPWSEEDKLVGREVFSWESVLDVWKKGAEATRWRINDSNLVWDRYLDLAIQDLGRSRSPEKIAEVNTLFANRLQLPHSTWDQTFQAFSSFVSNYYNTKYEEIMVETNAKGADAKAMWDAREVRETQLRRAAEAGDTATEWTTFSEYLEWEISQNRRKRLVSFDLITTLYQRAVLRFPNDANLWEDYVMFSIDEAMHRHTSVSALHALERATRHCPWSGSLWSQHLLSAEREHCTFVQIADIKHKATRTGLLDAGGIEEVLKVHTTWCSYLRRRAFQADSTDEDLDVAEVGIRSAIESIQEMGEKDAKALPNDPLFRLERIYIRYLSESGSWDSARETFRGLKSRHGHSYEFWLMFYNFELLCWSKFTQADSSPSASRRTPNPSYATAVLKQALRRTDLDWPEKVMSTYISHCEHYEDADELQLAVVEIRKATKAVAKRREKEALEAAAAAQAAAEAAPQQAVAEAGEPAGPSSQAVRDNNVHVGKRKRDGQQDVNGVATKRAKAEETEPTTVPEPESEPAPLKRDRENSTVVVTNLPADVTDVKIRQFFRNCGTINSLRTLPVEENSITAIIEFNTRDDAVTAQTRDQKTFDGHTISVSLGSGSTLFVTNFPPTADEAYIRELFSPYGDIVEVRFPSLKFNTHRRFCYVQFQSSSSAHAATALNDKSVTERLKLVVKISDPSRRQERTGPVAEGREIHVSNLDWKATDDDLKDLFAKYGKVEGAKIPTKADGGSKGFGFVVFSTKAILQDEANSALAMDQQEFRSRTLNIRIAAPTGPKRQATTIINRIGRSKSPSVEVNGSAASPSATSHTEIPTGDRQLRTLGLMNVPDTVNDARIRALVEPYGPLVKIILRPDHQGAIVEFVDVNDAGKAALRLGGHEIVPGRTLHVGTVSEMLKQSAERKIDRIQVGKQKATVMAHSAAPIRRPGQPGSGRRGGLGIKRGPMGREEVQAQTQSQSQTQSQNAKKGKSKRAAEPDGGSSAAKENHDTEMKDQQQTLTQTQTQVGNKNNDDFRAMIQQARSAT